MATKSEVCGAIQIRESATDLKLFTGKLLCLLSDFFIIVKLKFDAYAINFLTSPYLFDHADSIAVINPYISAFNPKEKSIT